MLQFFGYYDSIQISEGKSEMRDGKTEIDDPTPDGPDASTPLFSTIVDVNDNNEAPSIHCNNAVKVRVWSGTVGHVSLETKNVYMSLWPDSAVGKFDVAYGEARSGNFLSFAEDMRTKQEQPQQIFIIDNLPAVPAMELAFLGKIELLYLKGRLNWKLTGNNDSLVSKGQLFRTYNCSRFVHDRLRDAGIDALIKRPNAINNVPFMGISLLVFVIGLILFLAVKGNPTLNTVSLISWIVGLSTCCICYSYGCFYNIRYQTTKAYNAVSRPLDIVKLMNSAQGCVTSTDNEEMSDFGPIIRAINSEKYALDESFISSLRRAIGLTKTIFLQNVDNLLPLSSSPRYHSLQSRLTPLLHQLKEPRVQELDALLEESEILMKIIDNLVWSGSKKERFYQALDMASSDHVPLKTVYLKMKEQNIFSVVNHQYPFFEAMLDNLEAMPVSNEFCLYPFQVLPLFLAFVHNRVRIFQALQDDLTGQDDSKAGAARV